MATKIKVLCKVIQHGKAYGKKGDDIVVPDDVAASLAKGKNPKAKIVGKVTEEEAKE